MSDQDDEDARLPLFHSDIANQAIVTHPKLPVTTQGAFIWLGARSRIIKRTQPIEERPKALLRWPT
jgi:hypothetical protein